MADDKNEPRRIEIGGNAVAKATFKDHSGAEAKVTSVDWSSDSPGAIAITPDGKDPTTAHLLAISAGPSVIYAVGRGEDGGSVTPVLRVVVFEKGTIASGEIALSLQPAPAKA
jgi:hypothetical protein